MRILHAADLHLGLRRYGVDPMHTFKQLCKDALEELVDAVVLSGDVWDSRRPTPEQLQGFLAEVIPVTQEGIHVFVGSGNHDGPGIVAEKDHKTTGWMSLLDYPGLHALPTMSNVTYPLANGNLQVANLPYVHRTQMTPEQLAETIESFERMSDDPFIFVGHLSVEGSLLGAETKMQMGWDLTVPVQVFRKFDYAALGHIHRQQSFPGWNKVWYPGSPDYHTFGDVGPKGWLIVSFEKVIDDWSVAVKPKASSAAPFITIELPSDDLEGLDVIAKGAIVRVRVFGSQPPGKVQEIRTKVLAMGAKAVKVETVPVPRERSAVVLDPSTHILDMLGQFIRASTETKVPIEEYLEAAKLHIEEV